MSLLNSLLKVGDAMINKAMEKQGQQMRRNIDIKYGDKTLREWEYLWEYGGRLNSMNLEPYSCWVGLYKAVLNGKVVYVGRATEHSNGGLRKRLSDYTRDSDSARTHTSGKLMNKHASEIEIHLLLVGQDEEAVTITIKLERYFINKYKPEWNKQFI